MAFDKQNITTELAKNSLKLTRRQLNHCVKFNHLSKNQTIGVKWDTQREFKKINNRDMVDH